MRILLTGKSGQVGRALASTLAPMGTVMAVGRGQLDLMHPDAIRNAIRASKPDVIVNAAAYTAVDHAETEPDLAMAINGVAPGVMAEEAWRLKALLIHYSTHYVFDASKDTPHAEDDAPNPINTYGKSKLAGELAIRATGARHYLLRTSWVYSASGANFVNTMIHLSKERDELRIVDDQTGAPTWAGMIADVTAQLLAREVAPQSRLAADYGTYHLTASGAVTWYGFASAILAGTQALGAGNPRLVPIATSEYPLPARRPANSRLDTTRLQRLLGITLDPWQQGLSQCLREKLASSNRATS